MNRLLFFIGLVVAASAALSPVFAIGLAAGIFLAALIVLYWPGLAEWLI